MAQGSRTRREGEQPESRPGTALQPRASGALQPHRDASPSARARRVRAHPSPSLPRTTDSAAAVPAGTDELPCTPLRPGGAAASLRSLSRAFTVASLVSPRFRRAATAQLLCCISSRHVQWCPVQQTAKCSLHPSSFPRAVRSQQSPQSPRSPRGPRLPASSFHTIAVSSCNPPCPGALRELGAEQLPARSLLA